MWRVKVEFTYWLECAMSFHVFKEILYTCQCQDHALVVFFLKKVINTIISIRF